ncbi:TRAP transporter small permease [uncultured Cohaesibacter sp.]|uniref:TRAP transporter small permease n=1 Tax=uncultured Cohaesibacter sp. TaxID=1002546 RepID=UPI00292DBD5F|nr:TRAP transporter small permease [uncultured Cohaesibacter sp.]
MKHLVSWAIRTIEVTITALMGFMVVVVFTNVVLRYVFNSGLHLSDELSRYAFVWLTFLGSVLTLRDNSHVNIETVVAMLSRRGRLVCMALTQVIIFVCAIAMTWGTWKLHPLNSTMLATVSGIPMNWVSDVLGVTGICFAFIALARLFGILTGRISEDEIRAFAGQGHPEA